MQMPCHVNGNSPEIPTGLGFYNIDRTASWLATATGFAVTGVTTFGSGSTMGLAAGTAALPSLYLSSSTTTGLYRPAANVIGLSFAAKAGLALGATLPTLAAADDTAGQDVYVRTSDAGASATAARLGAALYFQTGAGSAGSAAIAGGAGAPTGRTTGAGGAKADTGTAVGGAGGAILDTTGAGGANASTGGSAAGASGAQGRTTGVGGAQTGASGAGAGGASGGITDTIGTGGASTNGTGGLGGAFARVGGVGGAGVTGGAGTSITDTCGAGGAGSTTGGVGGGYACVLGAAGSGGNVKAGDWTVTLAAATGSGLTSTPMFKGTVCQLVESYTTSLANGTVTASGTLSDAQHRGGFAYQDASGGSVTMTTRTAAQLVAAFPGCQVGSKIDLHVASNHASNTSTLSGGANVTLTGSGAVTQIGGHFIIIFTNVTSSSEAAIMLRVG